MFVLSATSNPEAATIQTARVATGEYAGETVAAAIVRGVNAINRAAAEQQAKVLRHVAYV